jgi:hypothetical protein
MPAVVPRTTSAFDSVRPITAIRTLFRGRLVRAWGGPYQGTKHIDGAAWFPYQPTTFQTPPFPEYSSGHSNFSAAGAEILSRFTHRVRFGASVMLPAGSSKVEPRTVPAQDVTLTLHASDKASSLGREREGEDHEAILRRNRRVGSGGRARSHGLGGGTNGRKRRRQRHRRWRRGVLAVRL